MKWIVGLLAQASGETTPIDFSFSPSTTWRLVNDAEVTYGWSISELRTFSDPNCQEPAAPARAEGASALGASASRALDGSTLTEWRAPCHICGLHEAWLTLHFDAPVALMCLELFQWGDRDYAAAAVLLQRKSGPGTEEWVTVLRGHQLQGGRWDALHFVQCAPLAAPNYGSVRLTNNGLYPSEATFTCKGIRPLTGSGTSVCGSDGQWSDTPPTCWEAIHFIAVISAVLAIDASAFVIYYRCYVVDQPKPLNDESIIPQDYLGKWNSELLGTGPSWGWGAGAVTGRGGIPEFVVEDARVKRVDVVPPDSCAPGFVIEEAETATDITHDSSFIRFTVMERS
ncbi:unnamed protein product [Durusdinium trenchii]|uniref:Sushi domain-containing protein n=1 Tax=Durusdinium trenchii TaxID=1381693 RepID=A0ABP0JSZ8_9DINO